MDTLNWMDNNALGVFAQFLPCGRTNTGRVGCDSRMEISSVNEFGSSRDDMRKRVWPGSHFFRSTSIVPPPARSFSKHEGGQGFALGAISL